MKKILSQFMLILSLLVFTASGSLNKSAVSQLPPKTADEVSFMSFNVENLFDTQRDGTHDDSTYLPLALKKTPEHQALCQKMTNPFYRSECLSLDWSEDVLKAKFKNISDVILNVDNNGPDMLVLLEVENLKVISRLNSEYLAKAGYQSVALVPSADKRGITIGFLSRFPLIRKPVMHKIPFIANNAKDRDYVNDTRGILEVTVKLPTGEPLTIFGAHFPSQANPHEWRLQAAQFMAELIKKKGSQMVIAGGDLNITSEEDKSHNMFNDIFSKEGMLVSHVVGCKDCLGSHNYRKSWSFLDAQIYSKALAANGTGAYELEPQTIDVIRYNPVHLYKGTMPKRFNPETLDGVSDHFPLYARLKKRETAKPAAVETK
jgi:endonuclease/exonuclease/phosphatase family metal-dependent hydrolase